MSKLIKKLLLVIAVALPMTSSFAKSPSLPEGGRLAEVHVLSVNFDGRNQASMVARPCDEFVKCENMLVRADNKTTWRDSGQIITHKEARKLDWLAAVVVVDKFGNALMINRMLTGEEK